MYRSMYQDIKKSTLLHQWHVCIYPSSIYTLRWRHNGRDCVSNHQPHHCLLNRVFRRRSKKASKLRVTGPAQRASNAENVSIWWRHHVLPLNCFATARVRHVIEQRDSRIKILQVCLPLIPLHKKCRGHVTNNNITINLRRLYKAYSYSLQYLKSDMCVYTRKLFNTNIAYSPTVLYSRWDNGRR